MAHGSGFSAQAGFMLQCACCSAHGLGRRGGRAHLGADPCAEEQKDLLDVVLALLEVLGRGLLERRQRALICPGRHCLRFHNASTHSSDSTLRFKNVSTQPSD
eukprot:2649701-Rhodomonas_salina.2